MGRNLREEIVSRERLTAPHYLAHSRILDNLPPGRHRALDFGCRYSMLPALLVDTGFVRVEAIDRDPLVQDYQRRVAKNLRVSFNWRVSWGNQPKMPLPYQDKFFDLVTAVWAVQHNFPLEEQISLMKHLSSCVAVGGSLLVVSSFTPGETFEDQDREDPQIILSLVDHARLRDQFYEGPIKMSLKELDHFQYIHGTTDGKFCKPEEANAICYKLERTG